MRKDHLEQFIRDNRAEFDRHYPPSAIWDRISDELDKTQYRPHARIFTLTKWAAAIVVILAVGFVIGMYTFSPNGENQQMMVNMSPGDFERYQEINQYYTHQVAQKMDEVQELKGQNPGTDAPSLDEDLSQLDAIFNDLKNELMKNHGADEEKIIDAMIINYQTKIDILERVAEKLKQQQTQQNNDETVDI